MMKIVASLIILGLCANVCSAFTATPVGTSQGSSFSGLNSTAQKVYTTSNSTDAANWDSSATSTSVTVATGVPYANVAFGPGTSNDTSYVYGLITTTTSGIQSITSIVKRTVNNTIVGYANDTGVETFYVGESKISSAIVAATSTVAAGPGYLAILSQGSDGTNNQVWYTLVSGTTASPVKVTSITDIVMATTTTTQGCTTTTFTLGNIWYDMGAGAFFYTYFKKVATQTAPTSAGGACTTTPLTSNPNAYTIYLGGVYVNGTAVMTTPLALAPANVNNLPSSLVAGGDNWLNSSNIYVVYKDNTIVTGGANSATGIVYYQKVTKSSSASAGTFTSLVADTIVGTIATGTASTSVVTTINTPKSVWSSNYTYGIAVSNSTETQTASQYNTPTPVAPVYTVSNYLNSSLTWADSGITYSSALGVASVMGWQLNTGYTLVASWLSSTSSTPEYTYAYTWGTFYGNGTVNMTSTTLGSVQGPVSFYEDVNGTQWIGWTDVETVNSPIMTYAGYLGKLQGQLNVPSGASILSALSAFFALFLLAIFVF